MYCIVFGRRNALANSTVLNVSTDGTSAEQVSETTLLGVKLEKLLSWPDHTDYTVSTMSDAVGSLVLSHLEYCPLIWSNAAEKHLKTLQSVQNRVPDELLIVPTTLM